MTDGPLKGFRAVPDGKHVVRRSPASPPPAPPSRPCLQLRNEGPRLDLNPFEPDPIYLSDADAASLLWKRAGILMARRAAHRGHDRDALSWLETRSWSEGKTYFDECGSFEDFCMALAIAQERHEAEAAGRQPEIGLGYSVWEVAFSYFVKPGILTAEPIPTLRVLTQLYTTAAAACIEFAGRRLPASTKAPWQPGHTIRELATAQEWTRIDEALRAQGYAGAVIRPGTRSEPI